MSFSKLSSLYTLIVCGFLLIAGGWGLFRHVVFGGLTISVYQAIAFIVLAIAGIVAAIQSDVRNFNLTAGIILCLTGMCWYINSAEVLVRIFHMNALMAYLNITLGTIFLISGLLLPRKPKHEQNLVILF